LEVNLLASKFPFQGMHKQNTHRKGYYTRRHSPFSLPTLYGAPLPCACIGRMVLRGSDFCSRPAELPRYFRALQPSLRHTSHNRSIDLNVHMRMKMYSPCLPTVTS
jgi:hypothetical protein